LWKIAARWLELSDLRFWVRVRRAGHYLGVLRGGGGCGGRGIFMHSALRLREVYKCDGRVEVKVEV
jgi:hypothetical protein